MPGYDDKGRSIMVIRAGIHNPRKFSMDEVMKSSMMILSIKEQESEPDTVAGIVQVLDMKNLDSNHFMQMTPALAKKMTVVTQV